MQVPMGDGTAVRMAGYMEKRGKLKLMSSWKKYWFVLEGQLLLYYKSEQEYSNLSACRGSLNIGLASCVRPGSGHGLTLQVVTRTQCVTLRTKERSLQEQWLQALLDSMALPNTSSLKRNSTGTQHFRYSLDNLPAITETDEYSGREDEDKKTTLPRNVSRRNSVLHRIQRMGGVSYNTATTNIKPHAKLIKTTSAPTVPGDVVPSNSSKEAFINNLMVIQDLLDETSKKTQENSAEVAQESSDMKNIDCDCNISDEYSELILNETLQDENKTSSQEPEEAMSENNCYESLEARKSVDDEEEVEYSDYDRVALMNNLKQVEDMEPDLPPRPVKVITEYEDMDLVTHTENKHSNLRDKMHVFKDSRRIKMLKKSSSQELQVEDGKKVKKRKNSFLNKIVLRLKRKESVEEIQTVREEVLAESEEEPIYESVTFQPYPDPNLAEPETLLVEKYLKDKAEKQLPASTIQELKERMDLKSRGGIINYEVEDNEGYDTICLMPKNEERTEEPSQSVKSSLEHVYPRSTGASSENINADFKESIPEHMYAKSTKATKNKKLDIPSLPLKHVQRPTSPWHDIPTNNSPVDPLPPSATENGLTSIPDNILNTPKGFQMIKNHWQQAERSGEWNREHQQVAFPNKIRDKITAPSDSKYQSLESLSSKSESNDTAPAKIITNTMEQLDSLEKPFDESSSIKESNEIPLEENELPLPSKEESYLIENDIYYTTQTVSHDLIELEHTDDTIYINSIAKILPHPCDSQVPNIMDTSIEEKDSIHDSLIDTDGEIVGINRYSDELHLLLTQLAEITSAPLFHIGATKSLIATSDTFSALDVELGPIRRRRHSDPDYDIPRPHQSIFARDTPEISMSPDSLEPGLEHFLADVC